MHDISTDLTLYKQNYPSMKQKTCKAPSLLLCSHQGSMSHQKTWFSQNTGHRLGNRIWLGDWMRLSPPRPSRCPSLAATAQVAVASGRSLATQIAVQGKTWLSRNTPVILNNLGYRLGCSTIHLSAECCNAAGHRGKLTSHLFRENTGRRPKFASSILEVMRTKRRCILSETLKVQVTYYKKWAI